MRRWSAGLLSVLVLPAGAVVASEGEGMGSIQGPIGITHPRPEWMHDEGVVIAGNWSTLLQRKTPENVPWTQKGHGLTDAEAAAAYIEENSPRMYDRLKELGVTMVILPLWSGLGTWEQELPGMQDSKRIAEIVRERGMRVGVYILPWMQNNALQEADPEAYDWLVWSAPDLASRPMGGMQYLNHPGYQALLRRLIDYAIKEVKADLIHFDGFSAPCGWSPAAMKDFRTYLRAKYTPDQLRQLFGNEDLKDVDKQAYAGLASVKQALGPGLPTVEVGKLSEAGVDPASIEYKYFQVWVLGEAYRKLADYARSLNPEVGVDINCSGLDVRTFAGIDLSQLVAFGDGFWFEQAQFGWKPDQQNLKTGIRFFKVARLYGQIGLLWAGSLQHSVESLAFGDDIMGCLIWFLYGKANWSEGAFGCRIPADNSRLPLVHFYRQRRDLFNPDFPSDTFGSV